MMHATLKMRISIALASPMPQVVDKQPTMVCAASKTASAAQYAQMVRFCGSAAPYASVLTDLRFSTRRSSVSTLPMIRSE